MNLLHDSMIAVADGEKFHLFRTDGNDARPHLHPAGHPHLEGSNHSAGSRHRSSPANPDEKQDAEDMHTIATAEWLNRAALENTFSQAVVIAPPRMLGELRKHYHKAFAAKIVREIPKDLTGLGIEEITTALELA